MCVIHVRMGVYVFARVSVRTVRRYYNLPAIVPVGGWISLIKHQRYKVLDVCTSSKPAYAYFAKAFTAIVLTSPSSQDDYLDSHDTYHVR